MGPKNLWNHDRSLPRVDHRNFPSPRTHQGGSLVQGRHVADQHCRRTRGPRCSGDGNARLRRQHALCCCCGGAYRRVSHRSAHAKGHDVHIRFKVHNVGRRLAASRHPFLRCHHQIARHGSENTLELCTIDNQWLGHAAPPGENWQPGFGAVLTSLAKGSIGGKPPANYTTYETGQIALKQNFISEGKEVTNESSLPPPMQ